ncbi:MAG: hypothetical protein SFU25_09275 [Candidatus Caenarcaniphilales bacterium]|nr:hypothetical protein [Candidatus Caenarcaniphilales bacterium]
MDFSFSAFADKLIPKNFLDYASFAFPPLGALKLGEAVASGFKGPQADQFANNTSSPQTPSFGLTPPEPAEINS